LLGPKSYRVKTLWVEKNFKSKNLFKKFGSKNVGSKEDFGSKNLLAQYCFVRQKFRTKETIRFKKISSPKKLDQKRITLKNCGLGKKNCWDQQILIF